MAARLQRPYIYFVRRLESIYLNLLYVVLLQHTTAVIHWTFTTSPGPALYFGIQLHIIDGHNGPFPIHRHCRPLGRKWLFFGRHSPKWWPMWMKFGKEFGISAMKAIWQVVARIFVGSIWLRPVHRFQAKRWGLRYHNSSYIQRICAISVANAQCVGIADFAVQKNSRSF